MPVSDKFSDVRRYKKYRRENNKQAVSGMPSKNFLESVL
jgi:rRNA maturation protein Nop10